MNATPSHWSSNLLFLIIAIGTEAGIANVWKFSYLAGANGGGLFVALYFIALIVVMNVLVARDDFGGWDLFQELLATLGRIAVKHRCDIATVASRAVLNWDHVAAIIVGATNASHLGANRKILDLELDAADVQAIQEVLRQRKGPLGDVYSLERDRTGRHGRIMKYDLHQKESFAT